MEMNGAHCLKYFAKHKTGTAGRLGLRNRMQQRESVGNLCSSSTTCTRGGKALEVLTLNTKSRLNKFERTCTQCL